MIGFNNGNERRRKHQRLPIVVLCDISEPETGKILGKGCIMNYSRGGLAMASSVDLAFDSLVNLVVDRLDQEGFVTVRVANVREVIDGFKSYGLEFEGLHPLQKVQMERRFKKLFQALLT